ncbi:MAG: PEP-CTERM sorting domain-containing protein [Acidobacteriaceae bacterium]|nr:PEP-CTERM sorting domain-containing protein [Acidobacteriaceae bacterium]
MKIRAKSCLLGVTALAVICAGLADADTITAAGLSATWQSWSSANLYSNPGQTPGTPYWNNSSGDGPKANIGWCLAGGGTCTLAAGVPGNLPYLGGSGGSSAPDLYFTASGNALVTLQVSSTDAKTSTNVSVFGYYLADSTGAPTGSVVQLFSSTDPAGKTATISFTPGQNYGFYTENIQGAGTPYATDYFFYMDSAYNSANGSMPADALQHFAIFQSGPSYFLGTVSADACQNGFLPQTSPCVLSSAFDYNDIVVQLGSVPEPASLGLLGGSLVLVGLFTRYRSRRSVS